MNFKKPLEPFSLAPSARKACQSRRPVVGRSVAERPSATRAGKTPLKCPSLRNL